MITENGYSKDPNIVPEGIAVTFGKEMIKEKGGLLSFIRWFESCLDEDDTEFSGHFMHKCKNKPQYDNILYVYVIVCNRIYYRCIYGGYEKGSTVGYATANGPLEDIHWPRIILAAPIKKAPFKMIRPGFQGFRYCTKLF